jgi:hypothetical protein
LQRHKTQHTAHTWRSCGSAVCNALWKTLKPSQLVHTLTQRCITNQTLVAAASTTKCACMLTCIPSPPVRTPRAGCHKSPHAGGCLQTAWAVWPPLSLRGANALLPVPQERPAPACVYTYVCMRTCVCVLVCVCVCLCVACLLCELACAHLLCSSEVHEPAAAESK